MMGGAAWWPATGSRWDGVGLVHTVPVNQKAVAEVVEVILRNANLRSCPVGRILIRIRPPGWTRNSAKEYLVLRYPYYTEVNVVAGTTEETKQRLAKALSGGILSAAGGEFARLPRTTLAHGAA